MDKLGNLLLILQENDLNKTYDNAIKSISSLKNALLVAKDEVNDEVMRLILEDKHLEIGKLAPIPSMCIEVVEYLDVLLKSENVKEQVEEKVEESLNDGLILDSTNESEDEDIYEYDGIVTTIKGIKVGAKLLHSSFGIPKRLKTGDNNFVA